MKPTTTVDFRAAVQAVRTEAQAKSQPSSGYTTEEESDDEAFEDAVDPSQQTEDIYKALPEQVKKDLETARRKLKSSPDEAGTDEEDETESSWKLFK